MYRRYFIIGFVFFLLVGAYFVFFNKDNNGKEYNKYYKKLVDRETYNNNLNGVSLSIYEIIENDGYVYSVIFDDVNEKENNIKVLVVEANVSKDDVEYFPSFGIIDNYGCALIPQGGQTSAKEKEMLSLNIEYSERIEYLLIYFNGNGEEQFVKVKVSDYLI